MLLKSYSKKIFNNECMPSAMSVQCIAHLNEDVGEALPFLNASLGGHTYELKDKQIPTHISGSWSDPQIDNDIEEIYKEEFKQSELYKKTQAEQEKAKAKLKTEEDKLKQKFQDLLKR